MTRLTSLFVCFPPVQFVSEVSAPGWVGCVDAESEDVEAKCIHPLKVVAELKHHATAKHNL